MLFWVDAQLSPAVARHLVNAHQVEAAHVRELGFASARDRVIFDAARAVRAVVVTKDADFPELVRQLGPPPQVLWVTMGNTSTAAVSEALSRTWLSLLAALRRGEPIVELVRAAG